MAKSALPHPTPTRFMEFVHGQDLEGVEAVALGRRTLFNTRKWRFPSTVVQVGMIKFDHEWIDGIFFGAGQEPGFIAGWVEPI